MANDLQAIREILDRGEVNHTVQYVGTGQFGRGNTALHIDFNNHDNYRLVIEFEPNGNFVMFDLEETGE